MIYALAYAFTRDWEALPRVARVAWDASSGEKEMAWYSWGSKSVCVVLCKVTKYGMERFVIRCFVLRSLGCYFVPSPMYYCPVS